MYWFVHAAHCILLSNGNSYIDDFTNEFFKFLKYTCIIKTESRIMNSERITDLRYKLYQLVFAPCYDILYYKAYHNCTCTCS